MGQGPCILVVSVTPFHVIVLEYSFRKYPIYHRRAGTGFKLNIRNLAYLSLILGPNTTSPFTNLGVSINYRPYSQIQVREGENIIPLGELDKNPGNNAVVRIVVQGWENNRVVLENIVLNEARRTSIFLR